MDEEEQCTPPAVRRHRQGRTQRNGSTQPNQTKQALPEAFFSFYVFTAVRRFMFFLDPKRTGALAFWACSGSFLSHSKTHGGATDPRFHKHHLPTTTTTTGRIAINHIVESRVMEELMELAMMGPPPPPPANTNENDEGAAAAAESPEAVWVRQQRAKNWFSAENALRVYNLVGGWGVWGVCCKVVVVVVVSGDCWLTETRHINKRTRQYLELDEDHNGLLSKRELLNYSAYGSCVRNTPYAFFTSTPTYHIPTPPPPSPPLFS